MKSTPKKRGPGRPPLPKTEVRVPVKICLHPKQAWRLFQLAQSKKLSMSKFVGQLIDAEKLK